jgi:uncharacterized protein
MTAPLEIDRCTDCSARIFPRRLGCPVCGSADLVAEAAGEGVVAHVTTVHRSPGSGLIPEADRPRLGLVMLDSNVRVIARCEADVFPGTRVELERRNDGAIVARRKAV